MKTRAREQAVPTWTQTTVANVVSRKKSRWSNIGSSSLRHKRIRVWSFELGAQGGCRMKLETRVSQEVR